MSRYVVATVDELPPGTRKIVTVGGREIGVFNIGGRYFAVRNRCPHMAGPLCTGRLGGALSSSKPGDYVLEREGEILRCPWHQWEFDLNTGQSWFDPARVRVRAYEAKVESGGAILDGQAVPDSPDMTESTANRNSNVVAAGRLPGPYVAEMYEVSVEQAYVVVNLGR